MPAASTLTKPLADSHGSLVGAFTLTPLPPAFPGHVAYLVTVEDPDAAGHFGARRYAGRVIGCLTKTKRGWAVTAYTDRQAYLTRSEGWDCPVDVPNQARGVRILLTYWWLRHHDYRTVGELTAQVCAKL